MTITKEQLDELEQKAKLLAAAPLRFNETASGSPDERLAEVAWRRAADDLRFAMTPNVVIRLVAIARAALAWGEADRRLQNAEYSIGDYDSAVEAVNEAADQIRAALRGEP